MFLSARVRVEFVCWGKTVSRRETKTGGIGVIVGHCALYERQAQKSNIVIVSQDITGQNRDAEQLSSVERARARSSEQARSIIRNTRRLERTSVWRSLDFDQSCCNSSCMPIPLRVI